MALPRPRLRIPALVIASLLVVAGCGVELNDDAKVSVDTDITTTEPEGGGGGGGGETTTTTEELPTELSIEALETLLPEAADVPNDYITSPGDGDDDDDDEGDNAFIEAMDDTCPGLSEALEAVTGAAEEGEDNQVQRTFAARDGRELIVELSLDDGGVTAEDTEALVDAAGDCADGFSFTEDDVNYDVIPSAELGELGDFSFTYVQNTRATQGEDSIVIRSTNLLVYRGGVGIRVTGSASPDDTGETAEVDIDTVEDLGTTLDEQVTALTD